MHAQKLAGTIEPLSFECPTCLLLQTVQCSSSEASPHNRDPSFDYLALADGTTYMLRSLPEDLRPQVLVGLPACPGRLCSVHAQKLARTIVTPRSDCIYLLALADCLV